MSKIIIASTNPVKIQAALRGFQAMFPDQIFEAEGVAAASEVSDQPKTDQETLQGALNRIKNARQAKPGADFWLGIEGGIEEKNNEMEVFAWVVIQDQDGKLGKSRTATLFLPPKITELIRQGKELGEADDIVFNRKNSKHQNGVVGILTNDAVDREKYYIDAVILALIPFKNETLY